MIIEVIAAFFVAYGFGILFNIKGKYLFLSGIAGSIGWFAYKLCLNLGSSDNLAYFIAALSFSIFCQICAIKYHTPYTILSICALIPLVPGYGVYNSMYQFLTGNYIKAIDYGVTTLSNAGSLALGVILISSIFRTKKGLRYLLKK
ncbi:MAG: threonine/serine exporter family protein [Inconstantimicrobium porci]|uniref:threonine/serine exporter family protein n=1 Tax=Inconstantimicrobium porci TaxID=2652291 RepID=UPI002A91546F|nr:threonine/serine exporter family protein [Inconstantimicrobium porci]MDY5913291.1 threonine/serine exporter family protein [Inconstantimicrobium porci]